MADLEAEVAGHTLDPARLEVAIEELVAEVVGGAGGGRARSRHGRPGPLARPGRGRAARARRRGHRHRRPARADLARDGGAVRSADGPGDPGTVFAGASRARGGWMRVQRTEFTHELADRLAGELRALAAAGCQLVLIEEPAAIGIGRDADDDANAAERALFVSTQARLLADAPGLHAMLVIAGGSASEAGAATILDAPYQSYLFDLIDGPDNWYLVARRARSDRGVVCGALSAGERRATRRRSWSGRPATRPRRTAAASSASASRTGRRSATSTRRPSDARSTPSSARPAWRPCRRTRRSPRASMSARSATPPTRRSALAGAGRPRPASVRPSARRATRAKPGCSRRATVGLSSLRVAPGQALGVPRIPTRRHPRLPMRERRSSRWASCTSRSR